MGSPAARRRRAPPRRTAYEFLNCTLFPFEAAEVGDRNGLIA